MYIIIPETFIEIGSLKLLEISIQTYPTNLSKVCVTTLLLWRYANFYKLMRTIYIFMTSTFHCECCQCFTFKRCDKFKLNCTSHGGMYSVHYFGKISITPKQWHWHWLLFQTLYNGYLSTMAIFLADSPYIDSCFKPLYNGHLSTSATFFCSQGGRCRELQLYLYVDVLRILSIFT